MPSIQCPMPGCGYITDDVDPACAAALLMIHNNVHTATASTPAAGKQRAPKITRPYIDKGSSEETWNAFLTRWQMFKRGTNLTAGEATQHLFQCCEEGLGNDILRSQPESVSGTEEDLITEIKKLAVTPVAISVRRSDLLTIRQDHSENVRSFFARINGKATTCAYSVECPSTTCTQKVEFTNVIVKDVLISGLVDEEIRKEVLGWPDLDVKDVKETVSFIEAKEMARDALMKQTTNAGVSTTQKTKAKGNTANQSKTNCRECHTEIEKFIWNNRKLFSINIRLWIYCFAKRNMYTGFIYLLPNVVIGFGLGLATVITGI